MVLPMYLKYYIKNFQIFLEYVYSFLSMLVNVLHFNNENIRKPSKSKKLQRNLSIGRMLYSFHNGILLERKKKYMQRTLLVCGFGKGKQPHFRSKTSDGKIL